MSEKITDSNFKEFTSSGIALLDCKANWCQPCVALSPIIDELSKEYSNIKIGKLDVDENPESTTSLGVRSIPTIILYKDGEIVERHTGMASKAQLKSLIDKHLN